MIGGNIGAAIHMLKVMNQQGGASQSWESYWANQTEVLFFGLYSEISGGQMPNKKTGSSDYLTVAGSAGSETYQCPNTAPYIAADTDYIWFKTDETQRTVTTAELIGYDLQRTPVKYQDASPNEIVAIMILKSGETITGTKRDYLFRDMWLPILWDNNLNGYGHIKDNRIGQQLWTPEATATFIDTFTDVYDTVLTSHIPDSANFMWSIDTGGFRVLDNNIYASNTAAINNVAYFDTGKTDPDMSMTLTIPDAYYAGGFWVRQKSATEYFRVLIRRGTEEVPEIRIYKAGSVIHSVGISHTPGDGVLRCVVSGNKFTVWWKGVKVIDEYETDGSWNTATNHGIYGYVASPYEKIMYDDFSIV